MDKNNKTLTKQKELLQNAISSEARKSQGKKDKGKNEIIEFLS